MRLTNAGAAISGLFDVQASDERLEQLARLTAERHWKRPYDEEWGRTATFLLRTAGAYVYCVLPIFRKNYYAVVRVRKEDIPPGDEQLSREDIEVRSVSVFEVDALQIACKELTEEP